MLIWFALKINSEEEYNEITSILYSAGFIWQYCLENPAYTDLANIKFLFIGKYKNQYILEWSVYFPQKTKIVIIFKEELQYIEQLKLILK